MDLAAAIAYARPLRNGVLATLKRDGRPQLSNITYYVDGNGTDDVGALHVSLTDTRAKTHNMRRDPRISIHVTAKDFWSYVVLEGDAELTPPAADPHDATADALVTYYRTVRGEHPDWDDYRAAMVADRRLVLTLRPQRAYGMDIRTDTAPAPREQAKD